MRAIAKNGYIDGVALFLEVDDKQLERIAKDADFAQIRHRRLQVKGHAKGPEKGCSERFHGREDCSTDWRSR